MSSIKGLVQGRFPLDKSRGLRKAVYKFHVFAILSLALIGCVHIQGLTSRTSASPQLPWSPPPEAQKPAVTLPPPVIPQELLSSKRNWTLADLVDIGLSNNMQTKAV